MLALTHTQRALAFGAVNLANVWGANVLKRGGEHRWFTWFLLDPSTARADASSAHADPSSRTLRGVRVRIWYRKLTASNGAPEWA